MYPTATETVTTGVHVPQQVVHHYNDGHHGVHYPKQASGTAKTALGIGIGALALGLLKGGFGGIFGGDCGRGFDNGYGYGYGNGCNNGCGHGHGHGHHGHCHDDKQSEIISAYQAKVAELQSEKYTDVAVLGLTEKFAYLDKQNAINGERIMCLAKDEAKDIWAIKEQIRAGLELEAERRECGDKNVFEYGQGHYIKGDLTLNPYKICCGRGCPCNSTTSSDKAAA